jgi:hypothetical protein
MSTENSLIDAALRGWKSNVERVDKLFGTLSPEQLEQQVTPGKNRLVYLWGHLAAVNDGLLPLLGIAERSSTAWLRGGTGPSPTTCPWLSSKSANCGLKLVTSARLRVACAS